MMMKERISFQPFHQFARDRKPTTRPTITLTGMNQKFTGFAMPVTMFVSRPVTAPTHGPARIPVSMVPMVSRYTGSFSSVAI